MMQKVVGSTLGCRNFHLNPSALGRDDPGPDGDVELPPGDRLDPDVVALEQKEI